MAYKVTEETIEQEIANALAQDLGGQERHALNGYTVSAMVESNERRYEQAANTTNSVHVRRSSLEQWGFTIVS